MVRARLILVGMFTALCACEEPLPPQELLPEIPLQLTFPREAANIALFLDDPQSIVVRTESPVDIDSIVARVGPLRDTLSYGGWDKGGGRIWHTTLRGAASLPPGPYELEVVAFGADGSRGRLEVELLRDPRPVVKLLVPGGHDDVVTPLSRLRVSCRDPVRGDCAEVRVYWSGPDGWVEVARGTTAIDTVVDWYALRAAPGWRYIVIEAESVSGRSNLGLAQFSFTVAPMEGLVPVDTVIGSIEDVDGARILSRGCDPSGAEGLLPGWCEEAGEVRLRITDRSSGAELVSPGLTYGGTSGSVSLLTSVGAMTNDPTGYDFTPTHFVNMGMLGELRVAGHFAVFTHDRQVLLRDHRATPGEAAWLAHVARAPTSSSYWQPEVDVASDGAVLFTLYPDSAVVLYRQGQLDTIAEHGHLVAFTGDGGIVYSRPTGTDYGSPYDVVLVQGSGDEVIGQIDDPYFGQILAKNGWVAFRGKSTTTGVTGWVRSPAGEVVPLPPGASWFIDIAADGRVLFVMDFYLHAPGPHLFDPATGETTRLTDFAHAAGFAEGEVWVSIGRYLFRPN